MTVRCTKGHRSITIRVIFLRWAFVDFPGFINQVGIRSANNAAIINQPAQCPHRIGAPTETKQINPVSMLIVLNQVAVTIENIFMDTRAGCTGRKTVVIRAKPPVVKHMLFLAILFRADRASHFQHIGRVIFTQVFFWAVPGSVRTDHDIRHRFSFLLSSFRLASGQLF